MTVASFGDFPAEYPRRDNARIVLVPVRYDGTSNLDEGGPTRGRRRILDASPNLEFYDIETDSEVYRQGIFTDVPVDVGPSVDKMVQAVRQRAARHLANAGGWSVSTWSSCVRSPATGPQTS